MVRQGGTASHGSGEKYAWTGAAMFWRRVGSTLESRFWLKEKRRSSNERKIPLRPRSVNLRWFFRHGTPGRPNLCRGECHVLHCEFHHGKNLGDGRLPQHDLLQGLSMLFLNRWGTLLYFPEGAVFLLNVMRWMQVLRESMRIIIKRSFLLFFII